MLLLFNAPEIFIKIPDIKKIYKINDSQIDELENAVAQLDNDIFFKAMSEERIARWENMLGIASLDDDTLDNRRLRINARILEKLPYSKRVLMRKLDTLAPDGYTLEISTDTVSVKLALKSKRMIQDVLEMLENSVPLNMTLNVSIIWNQYEGVSKYTYQELSQLTYSHIREEVFE